MPVLFEYCVGQKSTGSKLELLSEQQFKRQTRLYTEMCVEGFQPPQGLICSKDVVHQCRYVMGAETSAASLCLNPLQAPGPPTETRPVGPSRPRPTHVSF